MTHFEDALVALSGTRWTMIDATTHVPARPGLYAIYGDEQAWKDLDLEPRTATPLYVGKAEDSLSSRELQAHFAVNPDRRVQTGSSTVRRSFAALLRDQLGLRAQPRNTAKPGHFSNYGLTAEHDQQLTAWMHARLTVAVWPAPSTLGETLASIERDVIRRWTPALNLSENPHPTPGLSAARAAMAAEARAWRG